jgi:YVTN family beta-propeller protein
MRPPSVATSARPHGIRWLPGAREVVVTVEDSQAILTVDVGSGKVTRRVATGQDVSHMVVVTPDGRKAFVANIGSGSVTVIDLKAQRRLESIPTGEGAEGIALTPDGKEVWVTNRSADTVTVVSTASLDVVPPLATMVPPRAGSKAKRGGSDKAIPPEGATRGGKG